MNKIDAINDIIDNFNWDKVHKTMVNLNWTWYNSNNEPPSIGMLVRNANNLLHKAYDEAEREKCNCSIRTGGFHAKAFVDEDTKEIYSLELVFELCSWDYRHE